MLSQLAASVMAGEQRKLIVVIGAKGDLEFAMPFAEATEKWVEAAATAGDFETNVVTTKAELEAEISAAAENKPPELWIVLVGHGTFDQRVAKFNTEGPDVSAEELADWLDPIENELVFINTASASAPFLNRLKGANRTVISATKSGAEINVTRFGGFLADTLQDEAADLNKDDQVSILEAFLLASAKTNEFFEKENRLATESALLDDNGDGKGIRADWFEGLRVTRTAAEDAEPDGLRARQLHLIPNESDRQLSPESRKRRNELEREVEILRTKRAEMDIDEFFRRLEKIFVEIAGIYDS